MTAASTGPQSYSTGQRKFIVWASDYPEDGSVVVEAISIEDAKVKAAPKLNIPPAYMDARPLLEGS